MIARKVIVKRAGPFIAIPIAVACVAACGDEAAAPGAPPTLTSSPGDAPVEAGGDDVPPQLLLKDLGPTGRRMDILVLPGDAAVEVDGRPVRRRDGVVELTGRIGEARLLRVSKGQSFLEQRITIADTTGAPLVVKLEAQITASIQKIGPGASAGAASAAPGAAPTANPLLPDDFQ